MDRATDLASIDRKVSEVRLYLGPVHSSWRAALWGLLAVAVVCAALAWLSPWLLLGTGLSLAGAVYARRRDARAALARPFLEVHSWGLSRTDPLGEVRLAAWTEPFGVTVLADHSRSRALLAVTTALHTRYVGVRAEGPLAARLFLDAATVADSDAFSVHASPESSLSTEDAVVLLDLVEARAPQALHRILLSGARGERIVLDGRELRVERGATEASLRRTFDLSSPLEWRGYMFHETLGPVATIYQATWVRQGTFELVLVAPLPPEITRDGMRPNENTDRTALLRDLRLMQSLPEEPPPNELRTAIERVFMLPLRQALDKAPRAARSAPTGTRTSSPDLGV
ncbi:MAG TPA: IMP dehydrogenase [Polyangiaceae bacterium]